LAPAGLATLAPVRPVGGNDPWRAGEIAPIGPILSIGTAPDLEITPGRGTIHGVRTLAVDLADAVPILAAVAFGPSHPDLVWLCS
jgi:hypothetical protein